MTVYSDIDVKSEIVGGNVICRPLRPENINGSSIDLTIGAWFWRCDANPHGVFNPYDEAEIKRYFSGPYEAKPYASVYKKIGRGINLRSEWPPPAGDSVNMGHRYYNQQHPFKNIPEDWPVIVLRPRERILAHSHEFVGVRTFGTTMLKARSSTGRIGMKVCDDAGWGDPGFVNRWTFELSNSNEEAIVIPLGERLSQIIFMSTGPVGSSYAGKYQDSDDMDELIAKWSPYDMLPRTFKDERKEPLPLDKASYQKAISDLSSTLEYAAS